jgi:hypothetical protein
MFSTVTILPFNSAGSVEIKFKLIANVKRCCVEHVHYFQQDQLNFALVVT